jgi:hypothetical protein
MDLPTLTARPVWEIAPALAAAEATAEAALAPLAAPLAALLACRRNVKEDIW